MSEKLIRRKVITYLKKYNATPVENPACPGTPDICVRGIWIEAKFVKPKKNARTRVSVGNYRPAQKLWAQREHKAGGRSFILIQIDDNYYMVNPVKVNFILSWEDIYDLKRASEWWCEKKFFKKDLEDWIIKELKTSGDQNEN